MTHRVAFAALRSAILATIVGSAACGDDAAGEGEVTVTVYGEDFIEEGVPAEEMADGWAVTFDRFVVTVDEATVGGVTLPAADPIDIAPPTGGAGHPIASAVVPAGAHDGPSFVIGRAEVRGSATKGGVTKTFDWVFDAATRYAACETTTTLADGGSATFEITVHADHFFYDSLVAAEPALRFDAIAAADADDDGEVTAAELEAAGIGGYDPGSAGDVDDMWAWLVAQSRTLGHVDGEGHCVATPHTGS